VGCDIFQFLRWVSSFVGTCCPRDLANGGRSLFQNIGIHLKIPWCHNPEYCDVNAYSFEYLIPYFFFSNYALQPLRLIVRSGLDVPTFATGRLHTRAPRGGRWNCGREMSGNFCLNADFHITFRDLLHAVKLRHGTGGFTSCPKLGVVRIFSP